MSDTKRPRIQAAVYSSHEAVERGSIIARNRANSLRGQETDLQFLLRLAEHTQDVLYRYRVTPPRGTEYISPAALAITGRRPEDFHADPDLIVKAVHPDDRHLVHAAFQPDPARLRRSLLLRWVHPDGRIVWAEHRLVPILDDAGRMIAIEGVGRDVTERVEVGRWLAKHESRFRLLTENASDVIYRYGLSPVRCEYMSPASLSVTGYRPEDFYADRDLPWKALHPDDRGVLFRVRHESQKQTVVLRWCRPDGRMVWVEHRNTLVYDAKGRLIAIEGIARDVTEHLTIQNRLLESEEQLRRLAASIEAAREKERTDVARELHDELGQTLTGLKMELTRTFRDLLTSKLEPEMIDRIQSMVGGIELATETVRRLATSLRPPALDHLGLAAAIELEAASVSRRTGVRCRIAGTRQLTKLNPEQTTAVFRIVQEALTNVLRHANASAVRISLRQSPRHTSVTIHDNGCGIVGEAISDPASIGLLGMRERAELVGATLAITSKPGKGTSIAVTVPCRPSSQAADRS